MTNVHNKLKKNFIYTLTFFLFVPSFLYADTKINAIQPSEYLLTLSPLKEQHKLSQIIANQLLKIHYKKLTLDDQLSSKFFDRYISNLDSSKSFFLSSDIKEFEKYRYTLDNAIKSGELKAAFDIFNRYEHRVVERFVFLINFLDKSFDSIKFDVDEFLVIDRKKANWAKNTEELDTLWRKRLKNNILNLKLANKSMEKIKELLYTRYLNQLKREKQINSEDVFQIYINSYAKLFDPHTQYFSPRRSENFKINMSLSLEGIGAVLQRKDEYTKVIKLVPFGPAYKAKELKASDKIVGVGQGKDGEIVDVIGWRLDEVVDLIRGPKGTIVRLDTIPADAENETERKIISITRNKVKLEDQSASKRVIEIDHESKKYKIGVIEIPTFYLDFKGFQANNAKYKSATRDVRNLLKELEKEKVSGIVIDLRKNGGGSLTEANKLTGLFIKHGPIVQVKKSNGSINIVSDPDHGISYKGPLAVMINRLSASASEIFAGAIQDYKRGIIIGEESFGKGTVQSIVSLERGQLKTTVAKFYRINGESTQNKGIIPNIHYPSLYDKDDIGESSLPDSLAWDSIPPVSYQTYIKPYDSIIAKLIKTHKQRITANPEYEYLLAKVDRLKKAREKKTISLNEKDRKKEIDEIKKWRLDQENKLRKAKNLEPLTELKDEKEDEDDSKASKPDTPNNNSQKDEPKEDFLLIEAGNILVDLMSLL